MNDLAVLSLGLFFLFGLIRTSNKVTLAHATVVTVSCGLYVLKASTTDFLYLFSLTQIAFGLFNFVVVRPRNANSKIVWLAALLSLVFQLLYFKVRIANGAQMPVGLAYLTLQILGIFIWGYFQKSPAAITWTQFNFSALFFPTIIAGPILRSEQIAAQLKSAAPGNRDRLRSAFFLICLGLFKKAVADQLGLFTNENQVTLHPVGWRATMLIVAFYSQCYADFSGYSDIARGLARSYGLEIPLNFNVPFLAANITEHWKRWHISLNEWFRDYVFTWLFASNYLHFKRRVPQLSIRIHLGLSILLTCLLVGIWHGIEVRFLIWAVINGLCIVLHQSLFVRLPYSNSIFTAISICFTFLLTCLLNILFLEASLDEIQRIVRSSISFRDYSFATPHEQATILYSFFLIVLSVIGVHAIDRKFIQADYQVPSKIAFFCLTLFALAYCFSAGAIHQAFLYSRF